MSDETPTDEQTNNEEKKPHLQKVDGDNKTTPRVLIPKHREDLEGSGLDAKTIDASGMYSETSSGPVAEALGWGWRGGGGMLIPFYDYDSQAVLLTRVKPDKPRMKKRGGKRKAVKYEHPPNVPTAPYFGPGTIREQRLASATRIIWTEGEKKTLTLDMMGYAAIGLTGVHNFNDSEKYKNGDGLCWSTPLTKYAARFIAGKDHSICYDSDAATNDHVMLAARRLAGLLLDGGARSVQFVSIPGGDEKLGIDDYFVAFGEAKTRTVIQAGLPVAVGEEISPIAPRDPLVKLDSLAWLRGAKLGGDLRLPPRYDIRRDRSVWIEPAAENPQADFKEVTRAVVIPVRLLKQHGGDDERVELAWFVRGRWERSVVNRRSLRDARRVLSDSPPSTAITSNNAGLMVAWFEEFMRHNEDRLRCVSYVACGGWQETEGDGRCFMLNEPISKGIEETLVPDDSGDRADILTALAPQGEYDAHADVLREAFDADTTAAITILAALSAPFLKILDAPNYSINLFGDSSTGKTSLMKVAASTFGDPKSPGWVASWLASPAAIEARAETLCDLPLPFDEAGSGDASTIEKTVYMLNNGVGKSRSNRALGVRETPSWRCVCLSTGERELVDRHAATGAQIRLLQFRVASFGGERGAAWVDDVRERASANSGQVGRRWIEAVVDVDDWSDIRAQYNDAKRWFREHSKGHLMQRQAVYFALLWTVECLAHNVLGIGDESGSTVREFFLNSDDVQEIESASSRALECVSEWVISSPDSFPGLSLDSNGKLVTRKKFNGRPISGVKHSDRIYIFIGALAEHLKREGLSFTEAVRAWRSAGITRCDVKRNDTRVRFNGDRVRVVALSCEAIGMEAHDEEEHDGSEEFLE